MTEQSAAAIYAARSKTDEDRNESVHGQVEQILSRLKDRRIIAEPFTDQASGSKSNRGPGLAAAIEAVTEAAERDGTAELWVYHSSRLGRGSGKKGGARALGRLLYELQAVGVAVRSVTDDEFTTNEMLWGFASRQAAKYAEDLSAHVKRGYAQAAKRGSAAWISQGIRLGGYEVLKSFDSRGNVVHSARKHPEDAWIYETVWDMALNGASAQSIQLALSAKGARTRPARKDHQSKPFDVCRVSQVLDNPAYAGLVVHLGQVVGDGDWPRYVEPDDFWRLREERREKANVTRRGPGRPPVGYLLGGLAVCGECSGPMRAETSRPHRRDADRTRRYVCQDHRNHHRESEEWCPALPIDGDAADVLVIEGIWSLISDADALRAQLDAGRTAEAGKLARIASEAREEAAKKDRAVEKAQAGFDEALENGDNEAAAIYLGAVRRGQKAADQARTRLNAALDAANAEPEQDDGDALDRVHKMLVGKLKDAGGDVRKLNAVLRETFDCFWLKRTDAGLRISPVIWADALERMPSRPEAFRSGTLLPGGQDGLGALAVQGRKLPFTSENGDYRLRIELPAFTEVR